VKGYQAANGEIFKSRSIRQELRGIESLSSLSLYAIYSSIKNWGSGQEKGGRERRCWCRSQWVKALRCHRTWCTGVTLKRLPRFPAAHAQLASTPGSGSLMRFTFPQTITYSRMEVAELINCMIEPIPGPHKLRPSSQSRGLTGERIHCNVEMRKR
jgi:hypothetical protein